MHNTKRHSLSWLGSLAMHGAALGAMSAAVMVMPVQLTLQRGRSSIELQATMAAAPRSEPEPTPIEVEKTETVEETKPIEFASLEVVVEKLTGKPPLPKKPDATEQDSKPAETEHETALAKAEPTPNEKPPEVEVPPPPKRKMAEAKFDLPDAPVVSAAQTASQADNGAEYDEAPQPHFNPKPPYPADALAHRQEGRVWLRLQITVDGTVGDVQVTQSSGFDSLDLAAVETVRDWRFTPARRGGASVAVTCNLPINFRL